MKRGTAAKVILGKDTLMDVPAGIVHGTDVILGGKAGLLNDFGGLVLSNNLMLGKKVSRGTITTVTVRGAAPIILPDAIAGSLQAVKAFGGAEQSNLPIGYTQQQYIYMMAGSYIKVEDLLISAAYRIEFDFQTTTLSSQLRNYLGGRAAGVAAGGGFRLSKLAAGESTVNRVVLYGFESGTEYYDPTARFAADTRYKYTYSNGVCTLESGGSVVSTQTFTVTDNTSTNWGINSYTGGSSWQTETDGIYVYSLKVWNEQDELVMDLVPAIQQGTVPVVGFYDTVTGGFRGPSAGTFAAGGPAVPTPVVPIDIMSNNGVLRYSRNLLDPSESNIFIEETINAQGAAASSQNNWRTDYIPVIGGKTYVFFGRQKTDNTISAYSRINFYTSGRTPILPRPSYVEDTPTVATAPSNAAYARLSCAPYNSASRITREVFDMFNWVFADAAQEIPYQPYVEGGIYADGTVETIGVRGKNLFNQALFDTDVASTITYTTFEIPNGTYTMSTNFPYVGGVPNVFVFDGEVTSGAATPTNGVYDGQSRTITVTNGKYTVAYRSRTSSSSNTNNPKDYDFQLELGSTATTYAPYYNGGTATAEMLLKVGNYQDFQSILDGVVTRKVGAKVLDGTETGWTKLSGANYVSLPKTAISNMVNETDATCLSNSFVQVAHGSISLSEECFSVGASYMNFKKAGDPTAAQFKQYLADQYAAGTPVIVIYPLATETTESVTGQTLQVQAGDNTLEITQASLTGLELEATYKSLVQLTIQEVEDANLNNNVEVTIS